MSLAAARSPSDRESLLRLDPGLAELLPTARRPAAAEALRVDLCQIARGALDLTRLAAASPNHVGLLLTEGVVAREVLIGDTVSLELLGAGDVIRPWNLSGGGDLLATTIRWSVLSDNARAAVLDRRAAAAVTAFPEVMVALVDRVNARAARLAVTQAISQLQRVDRRLMAHFTHLADRWGRMTGDGVHVPLRLSHRMLAQLVGARRPTVSSAVSRLARAGELTRRPDGTWLVHGELRTRPPAPHVAPRRTVLVALR